MSGPEAGAGGWGARLVESVLENPWFSVLRQVVVMPDGTERTYWTLDFPSPAVAVVVRRNDEFLLMRQYRFIVGEHVWAIPSGGVEAGESLAEAARREVVEETGYRVEDLEHLMGFYASYGSGNQRFEIFLAHVGDDPPFQSHDSNEVIAVQWFSRARIREMLLADEIVDSLSLAPLLKLLVRESPRAA